MGTIQIHTDQWPIVLHISEGEPTQAQFDAYMLEATDMLLRGEPHVVVMDSTRVTRVSAYARGIKKDWLVKYNEALRRGCLGAAVVLSSPLLRFISSTIMVIRPFPVPYYVCETLEEAMVWARARVEEHQARAATGP